MQRLEELESLYTEVVINEKLRKFRLSVKQIQKMIENAYSEIRQKSGDYKYNSRKDETKLILPVLEYLPKLDQKYQEILSNFKNDVVGATKELVSQDARWVNVVEPKLFSGLHQGAKIALVRILQMMGLTNFKIKTTPEGFFVYPFHLINKYMQMNILTDLWRQKKIDDNIKKIIEDIIFDEKTQNQIAEEIKEYYGQKNLPVEPEAPPLDVDVDDEISTIPEPEQEESKEEETEEEVEKRKRLELMSKLGKNIKDNPEASTEKQKSLMAKINNMSRRPA